MINKKLRRKAVKNVANNRIRRRITFAVLKENDWYCLKILENWSKKTFNRLARFIFQRNEIQNVHFLNSFAENIKETG
jgi:hypothetical protein